MRESLTVDGQPQILILAPESERELRVFMRMACTEDRTEPCEVVETGTVDDALELARVRRFDIIVLTTTGEDVRRLVAAATGAAIVFFSLSETAPAEDDLFAAGVTDAIIKSQTQYFPTELWQSIKQILRVHKIQRERLYFAEILRERDRQVVELTSQLYRQLSYDSRTSLPKQAAILDRMTEECQRAQRYHLPLTLLLLGLEGFGDLMQNHGVETSDKAMGLMAERLRGIMRKTDVAGHYGVDSLLILLTNTDRFGAIHFCRRVTGILRPPLVLEEVSAALKFWFGLCEYRPSENTSQQGLMDRLLERMLRARDQGIEGVVVAE